jgi:hypothetical protein
MSLAEVPLYYLFRSVDLTGLPIFAGALAELDPAHRRRLVRSAHDAATR